MFEDLILLLQNSVEDLFSILKFLRIKPLNDWPHFNETIVKPVKAGRSTLAMKRLQVCPILCKGESPPYF